MDQSLYQTISKPADKGDIKLIDKDDQPMVIKMFPQSEDDKKTIGFLNQRFSDMEESRPDHLWEIRQAQFEALTSWNDDNTAETNLPIEFATIRNKMADALSQKPIFTFEAVEKDDINKVNITEQLWEFVWNEADSDKELFDLFLATYIFGTGFWFEGMHKERRTEFLPKVDNEGVVTGEAKQTVRSWLKGFALDIRDVYVDPVHDIELASDCFILERNVSKETLKNLKDDKNYNPEQIDMALRMDHSQQNDKKVFTTKEEDHTNDDQKGKYILYHYYNKEKGVYVVSVDRRIIIREGVIPFAHGELPISVLLDHKNPFSLYGRGECELLESTKYERNVQRNMMVDRSRRANDVKVAIGQGLSLEEQGFIDEVTQVLSFDGDLSQFQYLRPPPSDSSLFNVDEILRKDATWITGIDNDALFGQPQRTAFEARLQEQNKLKGVNVSLKLADFFFKRMAIQRVSNIQLWLPITTGRKIIGTSKFRTIPIKDTTIEPSKSLKEKDGKFSAEETGFKFIDTPGLTAFLELTPERIRSNVDVQVTTPSTSPVLKDLNNLELQQLSNLIIEVAQVQPEVIKKFDFDKLISERIEAIGKNPQDFQIKVGEDKSIQDTRQQVLEDLPLPFKTRVQPERGQLNPITENPELAQVTQGQV